MKVILKGGELDGRRYERIASLGLTSKLTIVLVDGVDKLGDHLKGGAPEGVKHQYRLTEKVLDGMPVYEPA